MLDPALDVDDGLVGIALKPTPVELLGCRPELDDEVAGEVLRFDLAALLVPEPHPSFSTFPFRGTIRPRESPRSLYSVI